MSIMRPGFGITRVRFNGYNLSPRTASTPYEIRRKGINKRRKVAKLSAFFRKCRFQNVPNRNTIFWQYVSPGLRSGDGKSGWFTASG